MKKILAQSELSLIDKKKKSFERVPRRENSSHDRKIEQRLLNDDDDDEDDKKKFRKKKQTLKRHIQEELQTKTSIIPKKSRRNKYFLLNHPELKDAVQEISKAKKRKHEEIEEEPVSQPPPPPPPSLSSVEEKKTSICDKLVSHMVTSRFRYLNEKLYTTTSSDAQKLFQKDPQSFYAYHQGYSVRKREEKKTF